MIIFGAYFIHTIFTVFVTILRMAYGNKESSSLSGAFIYHCFYEHLSILLVCALNSLVINEVSKFYQVPFHLQIKTIPYFRCKK